jgi:hypothetical protein
MVSTTPTHVTASGYEVGGFVPFFGMEGHCTRGARRLRESCLFATLPGRVPSTPVNPAGVGTVVVPSMVENVRVTVEDVVLVTSGNCEVVVVCSVTIV